MFLTCTTKNRSKRPCAQEPSARAADERNSQPTPTFKLSRRFLSRPRLRTSQYRTKVTAAAAAAAAAPAGGKENSQAKGPGAGPREVQLPAGLRDISPNALTQAARSAAAAAAAGAAGESWAACARSGSGDELEVARGAGAGSASAQRSNGRTHQGSAASAAAVRGDGVEAYLLPAGDRCLPS